MNQSVNINELLASLVSVQGQLPTLAKDKQGYSYKYADLDSLVTTIKPIFKAEGIGFMQSLTVIDGKNAITTRIFNVCGQYIEDTVLLPAVEMKSVTSAQALGASITYMRRYALSSMLGITSDEDVDGAGDVPKTTPTPKTDAPQPKSITRSPIVALYNKILSAQFEGGQLIYTAEEKTAWLKTFDTYTKQYGTQAGSERALKELKANFKDVKTGSDYPDA